MRFLFCFLHWSNIYRPNNKAFECFYICSFICWHSNFFTFGGDSFDAESHSPSTESTSSETIHWLSQHGVRLYVNWVNTEWWNLHKCWCLLRWLSWCGISLCVDSVDVKSHSVWLSWRGVSLRIDSVDRVSHSVLTQCAEDESSQNRHT